MQTYYDSGFDGDMGNAYGGASYEEEERRRRREQQAQQQQQSPYQTPADDERRQPQYQNQSPAQQPQQQTQTQQRPQQDTRTFAQRQAAGEARPAPSAVTPYEQVATGEETRGMGLPPVLKQGAPVSGVTPGGIDPLRVAMPQVSNQNFSTGVIERMGGVVNPDGSSTWSNVEVPVQNAPVFRGGETPPPTAPNGSKFMADSGVTWTKRGGVWVVEATAGAPNDGMPTGYAALTPDVLANQNAATLGVRGGLSTAGIEQFTKQYGRPTSAAQLQTLANNLTNVEVPNSFRAFIDPATGRPVRDEVFRGNLAEFLESGDNAGVSLEEATPAEELPVGDLINVRGMPLPPNAINNMRPGVPMGRPSVADPGNFLQSQLDRPRPTFNMPTAPSSNDLMRQAQGLMPGVSQRGVDPLASAGGSMTGGAEVAGMRSALEEAIRNPSAFDNEQVMALYNRLGQGIDDQFSQEERSLRNEMAQRGLADSSIQGGRLSDLNIGRRQARTELADRLATARAQDFGQARNAALGLGLQQQGQTNSFGLANRGLDLQESGQLFGQNMQNLQFQNQLGQQGFGNQMALAELQRALSGDTYNQDTGWFDRYSRFGQQAFDNDLRMAEFNRLQQLDQDAYLNRLLGLGG